MTTPDGARVRALFDRIAPRYDLANSLMSAGVDRHWRRRAARRLSPRAGQRLLDLACGTGASARAILEVAPTARVVGADFSRAMLARGSATALAVDLVQADACTLPLRTGSLDGALCAFGLRNVADLDRALGELARVLRPGGRLCVLEFFRPETGGPKLLLDGLARRIGRLASGDRAAYDYLAASVRGFLSPAAFADRLAASGFSAVAAEPLFPAGVATLVHGVRT